MSAFSPLSKDHQPSLESFKDEMRRTFVMGLAQSLGHGKYSINAMLIPLPICPFLPDLALESKRRMWEGKKIPISVNNFRRLVAYITLFKAQNVLL